MAHTDTPSYRLRQSQCSVDIDRARLLRGDCFPTDHQPDEFDQECQHILIEDQRSDQLVCTFRYKVFSTGAALDGAYAAQFYGLENLWRFKQPMLEIGRFCVAEGMGDPTILRLAWAHIGGIVDRENIGILFGCSSFDGIDVGKYAQSFALLQRRYLAPDQWRLGIKAPEVFHLNPAQLPQQLEPAVAQRDLPPLLRSYLTMGGWVSDHAVIDRQMNTLHVFTGLEVASVPPARRRFLRADPN
ncbi:ornithine-acyl-ACP acyltransferase [Amylibacter marinus]|uniref:L-ornithine N(alpha)-acyltransferase n=1 Tax=Amylibacter marinus TaxID=1475483 RepID=A0ABQ5VU50_9RHOB|nr:GNAT family N-acyltransferase [Amylibacter marinus]GLQ34796.1 ornithine-acyl-ACP acyltransferase [Amylibacter marinus]